MGFVEFIGGYDSSYHERWQLTGWKTMQVRQRDGSDGKKQEEIIEF